MDALSQAFSEDRLSLEELEQRMASAQACSTVTELQALVGDLGLERVRARVEPVASEQSTAIEPARTAKLAPLSTPEHAFALFGAIERRPVGQVGALQATAILGSIVLDLGDLELEHGTVNLLATAYLGSIEIYAPAHVRIQCEGTAILGSFEGPNARVSGPTDGPVLRIRGIALFGSVEVHASPDKRGA